MTHVSSEPKSSVSVLWRRGLGSPEVTEAQLTWSVAQDYANYWVGMKTEVIRIGRAAPAPASTLGVERDNKAAITVETKTIVNLVLKDISGIFVFTEIWHIVIFDHSFVSVCLV